MTREEAINHGKEQLAIFGGEHKKFIEMAIEALKFASNLHQTCITDESDIISRKEVHRILSLLATEGGKDAKLLLSDAHEMIDGLPSAQKMGRWVWNKCGCYWTCSECGQNPTRGMGYVQSHAERFIYCPTCGTYMKGEEDGTVN